MLTVFHPNGQTSQITTTEAANRRAWDTNIIIPRSHGHAGVARYAARVATNQNMPVVMWLDLHHDLYHLNGISA